MSQHCSLVITNIACEWDILPRVKLGVEVYRNPTIFFIKLQFLISEYNYETDRHRKGQAHNIVHESKQIQRSCFQVCYVVSQDCGLLN